MAEARSAAGETIAAIATAPGVGAVGIVRVSGPRARALAEALFASARPDFAGLKPHRLHHGRLIDAAGHTLDEALVAFMPGPGSFTGEDSVEFHCHGGPAVLHSVLDELLARGARLARAGEFSYRAFKNGRLDLAQAEAIAETIAAPTRAALHLAQMKLSGALSVRISSLRGRLENLLAQLCLAVDFPDEDVECLPLASLKAEALSVAGDLAALLAGVERARAWREGLLVVLAGRVNAGKSSLMNALIGRARAIVSASPGTTRDYLEEPLNLGGLLARLVDTAGLRRMAGDSKMAAAEDSPHAVIPAHAAHVAHAANAVEAAGQELSREFMSRAEAVLYVLDAARPPDAEDREALSGLDPARVLLVLNKGDLPEAAPDLAAFTGSGPDGAIFCVFPAVRVSAKTGEGVEDLCERLRSLLLRGAGEPDPDACAPNARQAANIRAAMDELNALARETESGLPYDVLGQRLDAARRQLAGITGEIAPDEVLERIFSQFCIGK
ncbi:MAG: tRNA uridine-5-carboxymethylaminomethyl(34) synthesis GTPase MnmE [Desulfovibrionaceae bacterium CG1_02_65_16]|nr:MAG: tRNA uridine-5-carboxymethylaminomethyl(34) synthesis GTPase MnmE [Desulfovibrionaceae bacterium CG1_02_65_16]